MVYSKWEREREINPTTSTNNKQTTTESKKRGGGIVWASVFTVYTYIQDPRMYMYLARMYVSSHVYMYVCMFPKKELLWPHLTYIRHSQCIRWTPKAGCTWKSCAPRSRIPCSEGRHASFRCYRNGDCALNRLFTWRRNEIGSFSFLNAHIHYIPCWAISHVIDRL